MKHLLTPAGVLLVLAAAGCSRTPDPALFVAAWTQAAHQKDAAGLWSLMDHPSQQRVVAALSKSKTLMGKDPSFLGLFAALNPGANPSETSEELAKVAIAAQIKDAPDPAATVANEGGNANLIGGQNKAALHLENGQWRVAVGAAGLVTQEGAVAVLTFGWPMPQAVPQKLKAAPIAAAVRRDDSGQPEGALVSESYFQVDPDGARRPYVETPDAAQPAITLVRTQKDPHGGDITKLTQDQQNELYFSNALVPDRITAFRVHVDVNGRTDKDLQIGYAQIARRLAELSKLPPEYSDQVARAMYYYTDRLTAETPGDRPFDVAFLSTLDGTLTTTFQIFHSATHASGPEPLPPLSFRALPDAL